MLLNMFLVKKETFEENITFKLASVKNSGEKESIPVIRNWLEHGFQLRVDDIFVEFSFFKKRIEY